MKPASDWKEADLDELHTGQIMESAGLEYKDSRALANTIHHKREMFKDVSAFANAGGGILIYGMKEHEHLPIGTDEGVDPSVIKREWIENIPSTNIQPPVEGLVIQPIILTSKGTGNVAYVIEIPAAKSRSPHQGPEHKYYRRRNFSAEPMEDSEVRDLMRRDNEYGRKYGAALDLYVEISRISVAATARAAVGSGLDINRAILGDGSQNKLILGASWATQSKPTEPQTTAGEYPLRKVLELVAASHAQTMNWRDFTFRRRRMAQYEVGKFNRYLQRLLACSLTRRQHHRCFNSAKREISAKS